MKRESAGGVASILISDLPDASSLMAHPQIDLVQDLIPRQISFLPKPENTKNNESHSPCKDQNSVTSSGAAAAAAASIVTTPPIHEESILLEPDDEARIKAELEIEIERDIEREIKAKIMMLNKKLEDLHVQQTRRHFQGLDQQTKESKSGVMERDYVKSSQMEDLKEVIKEETVQQKLPNAAMNINGTAVAAVPGTEQSLQEEVTRPNSAPSSLVDEPLPKISWNLMSTEGIMPPSGKQTNGFGMSSMMHMYPCTPPRMIVKELGPSSPIIGQLMQNGDVEALNSYMKKHSISSDCKKLAAADLQEHHNEKGHVCGRCSRAARHSNACVADRIQSRPKKFDWTQTLRAEDPSAASRPGPNASKDENSWKSVVRSLFAEDKSSNVTGKESKEKHRRAVSATESCVLSVSEKSSRGDTVSPSGDASAASTIPKQVSVQSMRHSQLQRPTTSSAGKSCQQNVTTPHDCTSGTKGNSGGFKVPSPQLFSRKLVQKSTVWK